MITRLYQTMDIVAQSAVGQIIKAKADQAAIRIFTEGLRDPNSLGKYPADFELIAIGIQDEETGQITAYDKYTPILTGVQWLAIQTENQPR